jgi:LemA protein
VIVALIVILGIVLILALALVLSYNRFVSQRTLIRNAWANIDTELKRRYDLIPNLVETVKGYASHEREVFEEVARARAAAAGNTGSPAQQAAAEAPLVAALGRLFAVAENYPQLKANENFLQLQGELANTEDRIQAARRFYNANVQSYNARVGQFPSNIIAKQFHFTPEEFFEIPETERAAVQTAPRVDFSFQEPTGAAPAPEAPPTSAPPADSMPPAPAPAPPPAAPPVTPPPPPPSDQGGGSGAPSA